MNKVVNKLGILIGFLFFLAIYSYTVFDAYINFKNNESIIPNLALLFAFFAWRKVHQMDFMLKCYLSNKKMEV